MRSVFVELSERRRHAAIRPLDRRLLRSRTRDGRGLEGFEGEAHFVSQDMERAAKEKAEKAKGVKRRAESQTAASQTAQEERKEEPERPGPPRRAEGEEWLPFARAEARRSPAEEPLPLPEAQNQKGPPRKLTLQAASGAPSATEPSAPGCSGLGKTRTAAFAEAAFAAAFEMLHFSDAAGPVAQARVASLRVALWGAPRSRARLEMAQSKAACGAQVPNKRGPRPAPLQSRARASRIRPQRGGNLSNRLFVRDVVSFWLISRGLRGPGPRKGGLLRES